MMGHVPRRVGHDGCLVGSRAPSSASTGIGRRRDGPCIRWREIRWLKTHMFGLLASTGDHKNTRPAFSMRKGPSLENKNSHTVVRDWPSCVIGSFQSQGAQMPSPLGSKYRTDLWSMLCSIGEFAVYAINPKQLDRLRDRFSVAGAKDDRRDAYVSADCLRTDQHLFRRVQVSDPRLTGLRAWSRLTEELQEERVRLSNRIHQQLWRYYPQMLELTDDVSATWFLELWAKAPTPANARSLRKSTVERLLKL